MGKEIVHPGIMPLSQSRIFKLTYELKGNTEFVHRNYEDNTLYTQLHFNETSQCLVKHLIYVSTEFSL